MLKNSKTQICIKFSLVLVLALRTSASWASGKPKVFESRGKILYETFADTRRTIAPALDHCLLLHGYVVGEARAEAAAKSRAQFDRFWKQYFGASFVDALKEGPCGKVTIVMQESIKTSALDLTKRSEEFLRQKICTESSCAVFGHSKGGLVVTNLARRCMEQTSLAGETACQRIKKFYSSSGNNLGASYAALIYGLFLNDPHHPRLAEMERQSKLFHIDIDITSPQSMDYVPGKSNPMWVDISPLAPMEDGTPLAVKNDIRLENLGWLVGEYAAGATDHDFQKGKLPLFGCGSWLEWQTKAACAATALTFRTLHNPSLQTYFDQGLSAWRKDPKFLDPTSGTHDYLDLVSWQNHQVGDGLAEYGLSLKTCLNGGSAVSKCYTYSNANHASAAGSSPEVREDVLSFFGN